MSACQSGRDKGEEQGAACASWLVAEVVLDDNDAFEELCRTIASAPHCGRAFPRSARALSPRMERLEDVVAWLWPHFRAVDPQCAECAEAAEVELLPTNPFFFALMRDATRCAGSKSRRGRGVSPC